MRGGVCARDAAFERVREDTGVHTWGGSAGGGQERGTRLTGGGPRWKGELRRWGGERTMAGDLGLTRVGHASGGEDKETPPLAKSSQVLTKQDPLAAPPAQFGSSASGEGTRCPPSDSRSSHTPGIIPCTPSRRRPPRRPSSMLSINPSTSHTALKHSALVTAAPSVAPAAILIAHLPRNDSGSTPFPAA